MSTYLYVGVSCGPGGGIVTDPARIVLDGAVQNVVWWCAEPVKGSLLRVRFDSGNGPFVTLRHEGQIVIGSGNVGTSGKGRDEFPCRIDIQSPELECAGDSVVINCVLQAIAADPTVHCDPNPSGPPQCYEV
jgi:hypothetical protein